MATAPISGDRMGHGLMTAYLAQYSQHAFLFDTNEISLQRISEVMQQTDLARSADGTCVLRVSDVSVEPPVMPHGLAGMDGDERMYPQDARVFLQDYVSRIMGRLCVVRKHDGLVIASDSSQQKTCFGYIPAMLRSRNCNLTKRIEREISENIGGNVDLQTRQVLLKYGEDSMESGGYYIMNGTEYVIVIGEKLRMNCGFVTVSGQGATPELNLTSSSEIGAPTIFNLYATKRAKGKGPKLGDGWDSELFAKTVFLTSEINVDILLRALGVENFKHFEHIASVLYGVHRTFWPEIASDSSHWRVQQFRKICLHLSKTMYASVSGSKVAPETMILSLLTKTTIERCSEWKRKQVSEGTFANFSNDDDNETRINQAMVYSILKDNLFTHMYFAELTTDDDLLTCETESDNRNEFMFRQSVPNSIQKRAILLVHYILRYCDVWLGFGHPDDRDNLGNKRISKDVENFYLKMWNLLTKPGGPRKPRTKQPDTSLHGILSMRLDSFVQQQHFETGDGNASAVDVSEYFRDIPIETMLAENGILHAFQSAFRTGILLPPGMHADIQAATVIIRMMRKSMASTNGQKVTSKVNSDKNSQSRAPRYVHDSQRGFIDPHVTSETESVGLRKSLTFVLQASHAHTSRADFRYLMEKIDGYVFTTPTTSSRELCFANGCFIGWCDAVELRNYLRCLRRSGEIFRDCSIRIDNEKCLTIYTDECRLRRPLIRVTPDLPRVLMDFFRRYNNDRNTKFTELGETHIEYVDAAEQDGSIHMRWQDDVTTASGIPSIRLVKDGEVKDILICKVKQAVDCWFDDASSENKPPPTVVDSMEPYGFLVAKSIDRWVTGLQSRYILCLLLKAYRTRNSQMYKRCVSLLESSILLSEETKTATPPFMNDDEEAFRLLKFAHGAVFTDRFAGKKKPTSKDRQILLDVFATTIIETAYSHCEIHPLTNSSIVAASMAFIDHMAGPRIQLAEKFMGQRNGVYHQHAASRMDHLSHSLVSPTLSLYDQKLGILRYAGTCSSIHPAAVECVFAVQALEENQEDALVVSSAAVESGMWDSVVNFVYEVCAGNTDSDDGATSTNTSMAGFQRIYGKTFKYTYTKSAIRKDGPGAGASSSSSSNHHQDDDENNHDGFGNSNVTNESNGATTLVQVASKRGVKDASCTYFGISGIFSDEFSLETAGYLSNHGLHLPGVFVNEGDYLIGAFQILGKAGNNPSDVLAIHEQLQQQIALHQMQQNTQNLQYGNAPPTTIMSEHGFLPEDTRITSAIQNVSAVVGPGRNGVVDSVVATQRPGSGSVSVRTCVRQHRRHTDGDKQAISAQKGTARILNFEDLPYDPLTGIRADFVINTIAIGPRLTLDVPFELPVSRYLGTQLGRRWTPSAFQKKTDQLGKITIENGGSDHTPCLLHPHTSILSNRISMGLVYNGKLSHAAVDKMQSRATRTQGPNVTALQQPEGGRDKNGGLRKGHMEKGPFDMTNAFSNVAKIYCEQSDGHIMRSCNHCHRFVPTHTGKCLYCGPDVTGLETSTELMVPYSSRYCMHLLGACGIGVTLSAPTENDSMS